MKTEVSELKEDQGTATLTSGRSLRLNEEDLRTLIEGIADGLSVVVERKVVLCNSAMANMIGSTVEQIIGTEAFDYIHPDDRERATERIRDILDGSALRVAEYRMVRADGEIFPASVSTSAVTYGGKRATVTTFRDISEQRRRDEALRLSEERLRESQRIAHVGSWGLELDANEAWWSEEVYRIFGLEPEGFKVTYESYMECVHPDDRPAVAKEVGRAMEEGGPYQTEHRVVRPDGTERFVDERGEVERDESGEAIRMLGTVQDVTEARLREAELTRVGQILEASREQLRALTTHLERVREEERTEVARDLHDEVGQAMTALQMDLSWLRQQPLPGNALKRLNAMVDLTNNAIDAGRRIASRLRPGVLDDLGLEAAVEWVADDFTTRSGVPCRVNVMQSAGALDRGVSTMLFRILQEALTNVARHAECSSVEIRLDLASDPLRLVIEDDGRGATDEELDDPKSLGVLGMRERAASFGGTVEFKGGAGSGTTVSVAIPRVR